MNQEQIDYVTSQLVLGVSAENIRQALSGAGYQDAQIEHLLQTAQGQSISQIPKPPVAPIKSDGLPMWGKVLIGLAVLVLAIGVSVATLVLSSLNDARDRSKDASYMTSLSNVRSQAEIHYATNEFSYVGFCDSSVVEGLMSGLKNAECITEKENYRVSAELLSGEFYCVDGGGNVGSQSIQPAGLSCGQETGIVTSKESRDTQINPEEAQVTKLNTEEEIKRELNMMRFEAELHYNRSDFAYTGFCDSSVVRSLQASIESAGCSAADDMYRVSVGLVSNEYYCIDGTGFAGDVAEQPYGVTCQNVVEDTATIDPPVYIEGVYDAIQFMRIDAELYYNDNNFSYAGVCDYLPGDHGVPYDVDCDDSDDQYRVSTLAVDQQTYWCIDSTGFSTGYDNGVQTQPTGLGCE